VQIEDRFISAPDPVRALLPMAVGVARPPEASDPFDAGILAEPKQLRLHGLSEEIAADISIAIAYPTAAPAVPGTARAGV